MAGYFRIQRGLYEHDLFRSKHPLSYFEAWVWLIEHANWQAQRFRSGYAMFDVPRGSLATHYRSIAKEWRWDHKRVARFLIMLQREQMIVLETTHRMVQITLCNYDKYQKPWDNDTPTEPQPSPSPAPEEGTKRRKDKESKEGKKVYTSDFEEFWKTYPRRDGSKADAFHAYLKATKEIAHEALIGSIGKLAEHHRSQGTEQRHIPHAATWLNGKRWEAEYTAGSGKPLSPAERDREARKGAVTLC